MFEADAEQEIVDAYHWYEEQSFGLGGEFLRAVKQSEAILTRNPFQYQIQYKEVRRAFLPRFPYALHYVVEENTGRIQAPTATLLVTGKKPHDQLRSSAIF